MKPTWMLGLIVILLIPKLLYAQLKTEDAEQVAQTFKERIIATVNSNNPEKFGDLYTEDAIMVLGNSHIIRGRQNIIQYMKAPSMNENIIMSHFIIDNIELDFPVVILDNDTFILTGTTDYQIVLNKAKSIRLPNRWISVFQRKNGKWLIASYQGTVNVFNNPYSEDTRRIFYLISLITFLLGVIVAVSWRRVKKRKSV